MTSSTLPGPTPQQTAALFNQAVAQYRANNWPAAEEALSQFLGRQPNSVDGLHLMALIHAGQGRQTEAEAFFKRALILAPRHVEILCNFANTLEAVGRANEAIAAYRKALDADPSALRAHLGLGEALLLSGNTSEAEAAYRAALAAHPTSIAAHQGLAVVLKRVDRPAEAEAAERAALALNPTAAQQAALEHNLGVSLKLQGKFEDALKHYDMAQTLSPDIPLADYNRANALQELGRFTEAISAYRWALQRNPLEINAHRDLNQLLYRLDREQEFLTSYDQALAQFPEAAVLPFLKGQTLLHCERYDAAVESFERALQINVDNGPAWDGLAVAAAKLNRFEQAMAAHERVVARMPDNPFPWTNYAQTLLQVGNPRKAQQMAEKALALAPRDQGALSMLSVALRALGDERDEALMGYGEHIQIFDIEPPEGYSDIEAFNRDLNEFLNTLHLDKRENFDQTLRGGSQTRGNIFDGRHDLVDQLRTRIEEAIATYIQRMKPDETHPLLGRRRDQFGFSASWSSRLHDCGFHTNHIHPKGWISSCYYIALPDAVADAEGKQGWIKFGEPAFDAGLKDPIRRAIQPKSGRLVLFPSYMWHGTIPFHSKEDRTTIAFDVVPKG
jgi:tetratricopeptide (TPR) repeat protein